MRGSPVYVKETHAIQDPAPRQREGHRDSTNCAHTRRADLDLKA